MDLTLDIVLHSDFIGYEKKFVEIYTFGPYGIHKKNNICVA